MKILLIEDDPRIEKIIQAWLSSFPGAEFELLWAERLHSGLEKLADGGIAVVLLDLNLPDSAGLDTLARVHAVAPSVPIVVLTGTDSGQIGVAAIQRGAQDYLIKGQVSKHAIVRALIYAIERKRIESQLHQSQREIQKSYETISQATRRLISPEVLTQLAQGSDDQPLRAEQLDTTILFADIRGFTSISEKFPPDLVVNLLNHLLGEMVVSVIEEGGMLDKFLGDGLMAIFGAPKKSENATLRAVRAAFKMQARVDIFNYQRVKLFPELLDLDDDLRIGIGIHCGIATVGFIGTADQCEYTAIGDCVNIASRLSSEAKGGEILLTRAVADACGEQGVFEHWRTLQLKGKTLSTQVGTLKYVRL